MTARHRAGGGRHRAAPGPTVAGRRPGAHRAPSPPHALGTAAVTALVAGCALVGSSLAPGPAAPAAQAQAELAAPATAPAPSGVDAEPGSVVLASVQVPRPDGSALSTGPAPGPAVAAPSALSIPAIGVQSSLVPLGVAGDGTLEVPADAAQAGWFTGGALPGAPGPAVVAGHVDSRSGPGVFIALEDLAVGEEVVVEREDGSAARFVVTGSLQVPKGQFPAERVYGPTAGPELRLITCDGPFDAATGHYEDNLVVFARLVA